MIDVQPLPWHTARKPNESLFMFRLVEQSGAHEGETVRTEQLTDREAAARNERMMCLKYMR